MLQQHHFPQQRVSRHVGVGVVAQHMSILLENLRSLTLDGGDSKLLMTSNALKNMNQFYYVARSLIIV